MRVYEFKICWDVAHQKNRQACQKGKRAKLMCRWRWYQRRWLMSWTTSGDVQSNRIDDGRPKCGNAQSIKSVRMSAQGAANVSTLSSENKQRASRREMGQWREEVQRRVKRRNVRSCRKAARHHSKEAECCEDFQFFFSSCCSWIYENGNCRVLAVGLAFEESKRPAQKNVAAWRWSPS